MPTALRFSDDADILRYEPTFEQHVKKVNGSWDHWRLVAIKEIDRKLRARRGTSDVFELGRIGERSREGLRDVEAWLAIHFAFVAADSQGAEPNTYFARKAGHYFSRAMDALDSEASALDYDTGNDGKITPDEQQRPFVARIRRG